MRDTEIEKKRILLVSHEMTYTGAPNSLLNIARLLRKHKYKVDVFTLEDGEFSAVFNRYGFDVKIFNNNIFNTDDYKILVKKYDIAICNTIFCGMEALKLQNILPTILYLREAENLPDILHGNNIDECCIRNAENIICVSEYAADYIKKIYSPKKIHILHNFLIKPALMTVTPNVVKEKLHFLIAATIEHRKGIHIAIDAFKSLPDELRDQAVLDIYGRAPEWSAYYHEPLLAEAYDGIIYHGEFKVNKKKIYQNSNVVLVPSFDESCSLTALEGAMYARPLIVTENVGAKYLVDNNGFVVKTGSADALANAMRFFIENKKEVRIAGYNSYKNFKKFSNQQEYYCGLNKIFKEVLWKKNK